MVSIQTTALLLVAALAAAPLRAALTFEEGLAVDPDSGRLLYREQHLLRYRDGVLSERLVLYLCADGTPFARKAVDYRDSPIAPRFQLDDVRVDYSEGMRVGPSGLELFSRDGASEEARVLQAAASLVADAGFDAFVRAQWAALRRGEAVPLAFAVPSRLASYGFRLEPRGSVQIEGVAAQRFQLRLSGLFGWFADPIEVSYAEADQRLLRFEGITNLRSDDGEEQVSARIDFPSPPATAVETDWQRAAAVSLKACRLRG